MLPRRWDRLPFLGRLFITASTALLIAGALMLFIAAGQVASEIRSDLRNELDKELETLPAAMAEAVVVGDFATMQQILDRYVERPLVIAVAFRDTSGVELSSSDPQPAENVPTWFRSYFGLNDLSGSAAVMIGGRSYGELKLQLGARLPVERAWNHLKAHLAILLLAIALDFCGIWLVLRHGLRPLAHLEAAARRVSEGQSGVQIPVEGSPEFRAVIEAFNRMAAAVKAHEANLVEARDRAEAANRAKSTFLATMSHEIRTPMNGILGMAQLLAMPDVNEAERRDYARTLIASGESLMSLLNDILDFSKIEADKVALEAVAVSPQRILEETRAQFGGLALGKGLTLTCAWLGEAAVYRGDPYRLRQMLANYVGNAIKFTAHGQVAVLAQEVSRGPSGAVLEFSVSDTGVGLAQSGRENLFEPFSQLDSSTTRQYGGTGLGLSIVSRLARAMGGEVGVESQPGLGARFWFRVCLEPLPEEVPAGESALRLPEGGQPPVQGCRVLVVEDNPVNSKVISSLLMRLGASVCTAANGRAALELLERGEQPALIFMDVKMPFLDGIATTKEIRRRERRSQRPPVHIVALTAGAFAEDREQCLAAGMNDFVAKPVGIEALRRVLASLPGNPGQGADKIA